MNRTYISELDLYVRIKQEPKRNQTGIRFYESNDDLVLSYGFTKMDFKTCGFGIGRYLDQINNDQFDVINEEKERPYTEMVGQFSLKGDK